MHLKNLLKVSCFILFCFFALPVMAQNKSVTGKVTDSKDGSPLIGASVSPKGSTSGTITDVNGSFTLSVPASATTLIITYIGYDRKEVLLTGPVVDVKLDPTNNSLNEVLVVGYGTVRKRMLRVLFKKYHRPILFRVLLQTLYRNCRVRHRAWLFQLHQAILTATRLYVYAVPLHYRAVTTRYMLSTVLKGPTSARCLQMISNRLIY